MSMVQELKDFAMRGNVIDIAIFLVIKAMNAAKKKEEAPAEPPTQEVLLTEIRNALLQR